MSDGESTTPAPRQRPRFGLPGPTSPAPGTDGAANGRPTYGQPSPAYGEPQGYGGQSYGTQGYGSPNQGYGSPNYGTQGYGSQPHDAQPFGSHPAPAGAGYPQTGPLPASGPGSTGTRRRRGVLPLVIGLVLLLIVAPAATIIGIVWSVSSLVGDATSGPTPMDGTSVTMELPANEMVIVYVPEADTGSAQCTAEGADPGAITTVPSTPTTTTFGNGEEYTQLLGVASLQDTQVTISCTGTDAPAYLGPYSLLGMMAPLVIGPIIGLVAGLTGLVLTIVGIVLLVRSRRA
ncbi:hypothetical protein [Brachybacterium aquaticum]|uniref:Uncharacterized protein n=1 Tax=Brachybacterium aquaticum TaxID=1432564 RepID=A0A841AAV6_9MICO|nr:hypothetical protein [Brachybacterium aquaticum]MBB5832339.1 hypothetical protein [Brachybacterium aquaticum]